MEEGMYTACVACGGKKGLDVPHQQLMQLRGIHDILEEEVAKGLTKKDRH